MLKIRKVLYPTDYSQPAAEALPHAAEVARRFKAKLTLLHVKTPFGSDPTTPDQEFPDEASYASHLKAQMQALKATVPSGAAVETRILSDTSPAEAILEFSEEKHIDLIVMGTLGKSGLKRWVLGSVAERVCRNAPCSVLTVGQGREDYNNRPDYQTVLIAYDLSSYSERAACAGLEFAERYGAKAHVLHVLERSVNPVFSDIWKQFIAREIPKVEVKAREALVQSLGSPLLPEVEIHVTAADQRADREIAESARRLNADLLVVGSHGSSGFERILMGSTTERLIRNAPCPVLAFRPGEAFEK